MNCEKMESVPSHNLYPLPLSQTVTLSQILPLERDILYARPPQNRIDQCFVTKSISATLAISLLFPAQSIFARKIALTAHAHRT